MGTRYVLAYRISLDTNKVIIFNGFWSSSITWDLIESYEVKCVGGEGATPKMYLLDKKGDTLATIDIWLLASDGQIVEDTINARLLEPQRSFDPG